jgi:UDP-3-O-[3-hydroxymyristoyl] glucosamine N-acyltransferase
MAAQAGIGGSTTIGEYNVFAGQSGAADHVSTPPGTTIGASTALTRKVTVPGAYLGALINRPAGEEKRIQVSLGMLPALIKRVRALEAEVERLKKDAGQ